jgi:acetyl-CoA carboxylase biotin carboxyl carrier protein
MTESTGAMQVDAALVRQLAELLDENTLTEIEVQDGERRIRVARAITVAAAAPVSVAAPVTAPAPSADIPAPPAAPNAANLVKSPMVGTVFLAAEPGAKPFAAVGDMVDEGATLVIIEAMKVMNPITATRAGRIAQVMVQDGQPVEYDQPLVVFE